VLTTIIFKLNNKWYFKNAASGNDANVIENSVPHLQAYITEHKLKENQQIANDERTEGLKKQKSDGEI
jgi:hypothetical protein